MEVTKTTETYEVGNTLRVIMLIVWFLVFITIFSVLIYFLWSEYKLEKGIIDETHAHNGTCISHGYYIECSYQGDKITIINSNSKCYRNDVEVNCSEIG